ncbi:MAG: hypothetical protein JWN98_263, partial [Abditibacteriota bacterium]|nr:hypothetical protein [Abditibacteriota bacterium]
QGPLEITKILQRDPNAMQNPDSPLWGPMSAPHHWGESHFGYYLSRDEWVLRRHAQMLSDAGVDVVIFDVTNQITYPRSYRALCRVWSQIRKEGGRTPQIAFLTPFWDPARVLRTLYEDLYRPGDYADLWFRWDGKPLIMGDPGLLTEESVRRTPREPSSLTLDGSLGQTFHATRPLTFVGAPFPTWSTKTSATTVSLYDRPGGKLLGRKRFTNMKDNAVFGLDFAKPLPPGNYYFEQSQLSGTAGWWSLLNDVYPGGRAYTDGVAANGDRTLSLKYFGDDTETVVASEGTVASPAESARLLREMHNFWTFRKPRPDYFDGPNGGKTGEWGWLDVYPQKVYKRSSGVPEQMTVGVAQNALDGKLSVLSNLRAHGRSFHNGQQPPPSGQDFTGRNFQEQWKRALQVDPQFLFITGWNEWIAGRFGADAPFYGAGPVAFVDQFNHEYSRDIEPVRGGHGDAYYYQFVSYMRRYKGARAPQMASGPRTIRIDGRFTDWQGVTPEFRDDRFDTTHRNEAGWDPKVRYINRSGRNDFVRSKIARDAKFVYAYAQTRAPLSPRAGEWMNLYLNTDNDLKTGWLGFDMAINRTAKAQGQSSVEAFRNGKWQPVGQAAFHARGHEIEIAIPRRLLAAASTPAAASKYFGLDFKWTDNTSTSGNALNVYSHGDTAPNGRFAYRYIAK